MVSHAMQCNVAFCDWVCLHQQFCRQARGWYVHSTQPPFWSQKEYEERRRRWDKRKLSLSFPGCDVSLNCHPQIYLLEVLEERIQPILILNPNFQLPKESFVEELVWLIKPNSIRRGRPNPVSPDILMKRGKRKLTRKEISRFDESKIIWLNFFSDWKKNEENWTKV